MTSIKPIESDHDTFMKVLCSYNGTQYAEMLGVQFYYRVGNLFVVCDNSKGKAETDTLDSLEECMEWFKGHESFDENEAMWMGEYLMNRR